MVKNSPSIDDKDKKSGSTKSSDEPSWYHYLIVIFIFLGLFYLAYFGIKVFSGAGRTVDSHGLVLTKYPYKIGNITYNLFFHSSEKELQNMYFPVEVSKYDLLNTRSFRFAFENYTGTHNGDVAIGSTMLLSFLRTVYKYHFNTSSFKKIYVLNCSNSSLADKVVVFDIYSNKTGVFYNSSNGCIKFETNDSKKMINLVDKLIYNVVNS